MVQGCSSWAGKSLLVTALCRSFARRGVRVAPFKAFNMSNNARVVDEGEIATAQYLQAAAAATAPDVRMNPVLVKPEADDRSQVVVLGRVDPELSKTPWRGRTASLWPRIEEAFHWLDERFDLVIAEGGRQPRRNQPVGRGRGEHACGRARRRPRGAGGRHRPRRILRTPLRHLVAPPGAPPSGHQGLRAQQVPRRSRAPRSRAGRDGTAHRGPGRGGDPDAPPPPPRRGRRRADRLDGR